MENIPNDPIPINDSFANEQLANVNVSSANVAFPWFANYANFIVGKVLPPHFTYQQRKKFFYDLRHYFWDDPFLHKKSVVVALHEALGRGAGGREEHGVDVVQSALQHNLPARRATPSAHELTSTYTDRDHQTSVQLAYHGILVARRGKAVLEQLVPSLVIQHAFRQEFVHQHRAQLGVWRRRRHQLHDASLPAKRALHCIAPISSYTRTSNRSAGRHAGRPE
jgi:hypothetical protein